MLGTLSDVMGVVVRSSMEQVIHALLHSSNTGCSLGARFSARYADKKEGGHLALEEENSDFITKKLGDLVPQCLTLLILKMGTRAVPASYMAVMIIG